MVDKEQRRYRRAQVMNNLMMAVLFTGMGLFLHALVVYFFGEEHAPNAEMEAKALLIVITTFNVFGFSIVWVNSYLKRRSPLFFGDMGKMIWSSILIAVILLLLNYGTVVFLKWFLGIRPPESLLGQGVMVLIITWLIEMFIVILLLALHSSRHMLNLYREKEQMKETVSKAQYLALQKQLNPHFLFNSLNTLIAEIHYDPENAAKFTQNLSDVYRYVLQQEDKEYVSLSEELAFLDSYMFLHRVRLGDSFGLVKQIPQEALAAKLPPLTLQLLAENVVKHNYIDDTNPIDIRLTVSPDGQTLAVANEMHPKQGVQPSGKGLNNLAERYRFLCDRTIDIQKTGSVFTVLIPLIYE